MKALSKLLGRYLEFPPSREILRDKTRLKRIDELQNEVGAQMDRDPLNMKLRKGDPEEYLTALIVRFSIGTLQRATPLEDWYAAATAALATFSSVRMVARLQTDGFHEHAVRFMSPIDDCQAFKSYLEEVQSRPEEWRSQIRKGVHPLLD